MQLTHYKHTLRASCLAYMSHAIVNNFAPLLFITFQDTYGISLQQLGLLVSFNFAIQLCIDFLTAHFRDRIGYRASMVIAHIFAAAGLHVSKTMGDLLGPCMFAIMMGLSRIIYAKNSGKISLQKFILGSSILCIITYLLAVFSKNPVIALTGCGAGLMIL